MVWEAPNCGERLGITRRRVRSAYANGVTVRYRRRHPAQGKRDLAGMPV